MSYEYEDIIINALEWAINVGTQTTEDLIRAMKITPKQLDAIGYDIENFPSMHRAAGVTEILVTGIMWDVDEDSEGNELPTSVVVPEDVNSAISDWLSDRYGFCHQGFKIEVKEEEKAESEKVYVLVEDCFKWSEAAVLGVYTSFETAQKAMLEVCEKYKSDNNIQDSVFIRERHNSIYIEMEVNWWIEESELNTEQEGNL